MHYEKSIDIAASSGAVWEVLADVERWPEWTDSMERVEVVSVPPLAVGTEVDVKQPKLPGQRWRITVWAPEQSFAWTSSKGGVTTVADHRLVPDGDSTTVTLVIDMTGPLAWLVGLVGGKLTRRYVDTEAQGLKARVER